MRQNEYGVNACPVRKLTDLTGSGDVPDTTCINAVSADGRGRLPLSETPSDNGGEQRKY